jgi:WD40 repeat protein
VWCVEFAHSGRQLASCSRDGSCAIWALNDVRPLPPGFRGASRARSQRNVLSLRRRLLLCRGGSDGGLLAAAWSPSDAHLVVCGVAGDAVLIRVQARRRERGRCVGRVLTRRRRRWRWWRTCTGTRRA